LPQQEEIIEPTLFAPGGFALISAQLLIMQALEGFSLTTRLLKDALLLIAQMFQARELAFDAMPVLVQGGFGRQNKTHFCGGCSRGNIP
jgi:hypothetical protein